MRRPRAPSRARSPATRSAAGRGRTLLVAALLLPACGRSPDGGTEITILAAASTAPFVTELAEWYRQERGVRVRCSFAASSTLARQIEHGAGADLFISANASWMDHLEQRGLVDGRSRRNLLGNRLVLVAPADAAFEARLAPDFDLAAACPGRIAVGDPAHVPLGMYTRQALEGLGWWSDVEDRLVPAVDARAAVRLVTLGETDAGIVYASDARSTDAVVVVATFPDHLHEPIRYPVCLVPDAPPAARRFAEALSDPVVVRLLAAHGFEVPQE